MTWTSLPIFTEWGSCLHFNHSLLLLIANCSLMTRILRSFFSLFLPISHLPSPFRSTYGPFCRAIQVIRNPTKQSASRPLPFSVHRRVIAACPSSRRKSRSPFPWEVQRFQPSCLPSRSSPLPFPLCICWKNYCAIHLPLVTTTVC